MSRSPAARRLASFPIAVSLLLIGACDPARKDAPEPRATAAAIVVEGDPRLPGVTTVDEALQEHLDRALASKGPEYVPRTRHLNEDGSPRFTNRLIEQSSPYLLQHAHNPVNWYPWSDEAFERAKRENKPIFL